MVVLRLSCVRVQEFQGYFGCDPLLDACLQSSDPFALVCATEECVAGFGCWSAASHGQRQRRRWKERQ